MNQSVVLLDPYVPGNSPCKPPFEMRLELRRLREPTKILVYVFLNKTIRQYVKSEPYRSSSMSQSIFFWPTKSDVSRANSIEAVFTNSECAFAKRPQMTAKFSKYNRSTSKMFKT